MALGADYVTLAEMHAYMTLTVTTYDAVLTEVIGSASEEIHDHCGRQFNDAGVVSARVFDAISTALVIVDDFSTITGLIVETDDIGTGTTWTTWTTADYRLEPLNGVQNGMTGWPFWRIRATGTKVFPQFANAGVRITARWGWAAVPKPVKQAAKILVAETFQLKDAPLGVVGMGEFGVIRVRDSRAASAKLRFYRRNRTLSA